VIGQFIASERSVSDCASGCTQSDSRILQQLHRYFLCWT